MINFSGYQLDQAGQGTLQPDTVDFGMVLHIADWKRPPDKPRHRKRDLRPCIRCEGKKRYETYRMATGDVII